MPPASKKLETKFSGEEDTHARAFSLEEHRTKMAKIWKDFEKYNDVLIDLKRRVEAIEKDEEDDDGK